MVASAARVRPPRRHPRPGAGIRLASEILSRCSDGIQPPRVRTGCSLAQRPGSTMPTRYARSRDGIVAILLAAAASTAGTAALPSIRGGAAGPAVEAYYMVVYSA